MWYYRGISKTLSISAFHIIYASKRSVDFITVVTSAEVFGNAETNTQYYWAKKGEPDIA